MMLLLPAQSCAEPMKYFYEYVPLHTGGGFWIDNAASEHRDIITEYAQQGWRYVGFVPTKFSSEGGIKEIDLIFEKEAE